MANDPGKALQDSDELPKREVLTADEVAAVLRTTGKTVREMASRGDLPHFKVGPAYRFLRSDVIAFMHAGPKRPRARTY